MSLSYIVSFLVANTPSTGATQDAPAEPTRERCGGLYPASPFLTLTLTPAPPPFSAMNYARLPITLAGRRSPLGLVGIPIP